MSTLILFEYPTFLPQYHGAVSVTSVTHINDGDFLLNEKPCDCIVARSVLFLLFVSSVSSSFSH